MHFMSKHNLAFNVVQQTETTETIISQTNQNKPVMYQAL